NVTLSATPSMIWPPNGRTENVIISGNGTDVVSGLANVTYVVTDEYGMPLSIPLHTLSGNPVQWTDSLAVEANRRGNDLDGRLYRVVATIIDLAGNTATASVDIIVP